MTPHVRVPTITLCALVFALGCQVEHPQSRTEKHAEELSSAQSKLETPHESTPTRTDEAQLVIHSCGNPAKDSVETIHDKLHDGPVRSLTYKGLREVRLQFVPSMVNTGPWEFTGADVENEDVLTASRLKVYLPCVAGALR